MHNIKGEYVEVGGRMWSQVGGSGKVAWQDKARPDFTFVRGRMGADG